MQMVEALRREEVRGVITPIVTPFNRDETIDFDCFERELSFMEASGIRVIIIGGSTGSGNELNAEELATLIRTATTKSNLRVIAGIIPDTTKDAIHRSLLAKEAGAAALLLCPPTYNGMTDESALAFITDVAAASELPIVFYDHFNYSVDLLKTIARLPEVIAIKCVFQNIGELVQTVGDHVTIAAGYDPITLAGYVMGAEASICGVHAVLPKQNVDIYRAFKDGNIAEAMQLTKAIGPICREVSQATNFPTRIKYAIGMLGRDVGTPIRPLDRIGETDKAAIDDALRVAGLR
ncbi:dihydrodipicolinate synthase family protein [bacterium M00.F.Ca.ET.141.01.1.1]|nr:MAG: dihydrodipicolinate synthase family protein [Mesorhizobium sp.]TGR27985.1 dihydrodipicolinate synthase family protein [Mesorhizobium sp. M8A.F.Ca.ET.197.01.1.1]TGR32387.1 dihydrodipicolinate synthase family protein [Mesorhizobium sp. M8A.F.Ca.ET.202.01.1.1]TGR43653.1 dihydrodipicolinate synthase family protein [bacterium M00.F.Ca.ET.199.01.1.1]TGR52959.1 dihydrodipicolinate synthase family protein [Mesorhizobium sp. M8A.F.Ca.ET.198.01.1.1]TGT36665.1 dihydrodipicolinate synthase family 